jgi:hypothetical protein
MIDILTSYRQETACNFLTFTPFCAQFNVILSVVYFLNSEGLYLEKIIDVYNAIFNPLKHEVHKGY